MKIELNDVIYDVEVAETEEQHEKGLQNRDSLPDDGGMLFIFDEVQTVGMWMDKTKIPLTIIFIDEDLEVISSFQGKPNDKTIVEEDNVKYVLELKAGVEVEQGDELDLEPDDEEVLAALQVLAPDGSVQMELEGGERIVSRKETKVLIRKAKKAYKLKNKPEYEKACKDLGRYMFRVLKGQNSRKPEYVENK